VKPRGPLAPRFYAVPLSGRMECPRCKTVLTWRVPRIPQYGRRPARRPDTWNPITSVITCSSCSQSYQLGIVAWPLSPQEAKQLRLPEDQALTPAIVAQARAGGFLSPEYRGDDPNVGTNQLVAEGCTCGELAWSSECAVHGR
jgi:hypothetical protein